MFSRPRVSGSDAAQTHALGVIKLAAPDISMSTSKQRSIEVQYNFVLSSDIEPPEQLLCEVSSPTSGHYTFPIRPEVSSTEDNKSHYRSLLVAMEEAKRVTGNDLTVWRDKVGDAENKKETSLPKPINEDDEGDGED